MSDDDIDFYDLLEIDEDASQEEVKQAFRTKVREYHPDLNDDPDAPAQFNALKKAYETLEDSSERNAYDRLGHRDYVAKRIGGFPSGDIWARTGDDGRSTQSRQTRDSSSGSRSHATSSHSRSRSTSSTTSSSTRGASSSTAGSSSGTSSTGSAGASTGWERISRWIDGTTRSASSPSTSGWTDNALFDWWNGLALGWPLMLSAALLYVVGLLQFVVAYGTAFSRLLDRLVAAGTDTAALQAAVGEGRYGLAQPAAFIAEEGALVAEPPLPRGQWYAALAGVVVVTVLAFGLNRAVRARYPYKWVSINETVGVALAATVSAVAFGGFLLAGIVVMPLVYLVIIRHTRVAFHFQPTYLYVVGVSAPVLGLVLDLAGVAPQLYVDLVTLALPVLSVVVLLLSAFVRPKITAKL
ncbi:DnaJ domain-containing protein [Haloarchaeobius sp. HRN-SO-5]|uniref:DnaJ domain-containing protein n=1 Tax=Haloarchaeobius sp. HRN-SO-5 TaxID=3446118 RepID=UPI003EBF1278